MKLRDIANLIQATETSDGAGVRIKRSLGGGSGARLDPFLMLDEFGSDQPDDYIAGFPSHPHRGFETVTYMLDGHMLHEDHLGNRGELRNGDVQWMTAGRGIVHSEMPQQESGLMRGFQLWLNLPAKEKMCEPFYQDIPSADIPVVELEGARVKVIAGTYVGESLSQAGVITARSTRPLYLDVHLSLGADFIHPVEAELNAFLYVYEGALRLNAADSRERDVPSSAAAVLGPGEVVSVRASAPDTRFLLLAGKPLNEPVVQYGPFVMNTREEIEQAIHDYQSGCLARPARAELNQKEKTS